MKNWSEWLNGGRLSDSFLFREDLNSHERLVLCFFASLLDFRRDPTDQILAPHPFDFARYTSMSESSLRRAIRDLEKRKFLVRKRGKPTGYQLTGNLFKSHRIHQQNKINVFNSMRGKTVTQTEMKPKKKTKKISNSDNLPSKTVTETEMGEILPLAGRPKRSHRPKSKSQNGHTDRFASIYKDNHNKNSYFLDAGAAAKAVIVSIQSTWDEASKFQKKWGKYFVDYDVVAGWGHEIAERHGLEALLQFKSKVEEISARVLERIRTTDNHAPMAKISNLSDFEKFLESYVLKPDSGDSRA